MTDTSTSQLPPQRSVFKWYALYAVIKKGDENVGYAIAVIALDDPTFAKAIPGTELRPVEEGSYSAGDLLKLDQKSNDIIGLWQPPQSQS
ncbi:hypothetical protein [Bombella apis]|uniref:hypothetical protein n=1 Tax=Bombella apis TaxID=1785988 RepID=UPI0012B8D0C0|nr:hypothetical protein [Bombella apis]MPV99804.1 hypothetical protein [Bombella apis]